MHLRVLLVEPGYHNKYPPLGLMKLSTFHKSRNDHVEFVKGLNESKAREPWDRIYVSSLFTFYWKQTVETINYYTHQALGRPEVIVGGVMATLMKDELEAATGARVIGSLLNQRGLLGLDGDEAVDTMIPDYSAVDPGANPLLGYTYPVADAYIGYATRGCIRHCSFCAVPTIEPDYEPYVDLVRQVRGIEESYGIKKDLLLLDNNVLASRQFPRIVEEIKSLGFERGATLKRSVNGRSMSVVRHVDFNQGIDSRLLNETNMELLSQLAVYPLRIAFDHVDLTDIYCSKVRLAAKYGIPNLSNYVLFNYEDDPRDLYQRLLVNVDLNEELAKIGLKTRVWSFPMRYCPVGGPESKNRHHVGPRWTAKQLRGVCCVLAATHGVVGPKKGFFLRAFGTSTDEFLHILDLPEDFIVHRVLHEENGDREWLQASIDDLSLNERATLQDMISRNTPSANLSTTANPRLEVLLEAYRHSDTPRRHSPCAGYALESVREGRTSE
jgi:hypothetical protein